MDRRGQGHAAWGQSFPPSWRTCSYDHGFLPAPRGQPPRQILRGPVRRRPLGLAAARHTELPGQDLPYDGDWQQRVDHGLFGPYPAWRQPCDAYPSSIAAGAREPVEQHGLAVAARPHQRHVVRRSVTAKQVRHALRQHPPAPSCARLGTAAPRTVAGLLPPLQSFLEGERHLTRISFLC